MTALGKVRLYTERVKSDLAARDKWIMQARRQGHGEQQIASAAQMTRQGVAKALIRIAKKSSQNA